MSDKISVWIMNSKGGVGKTTLSVAVADLFELLDRPLHLMEIDSRKRLSSFMGGDKVLSFEGAPPIEEIRQNPNVILGHYDPIVEEIIQGDTLLDLGANQDQQFLNYCKLSRLSEYLEGEKVSIVVLVPTVAENESVRGAMEALKEVGSVMPHAHRMLILNQRDGQSFEKYISPADRKRLQDEGVRVAEMPMILSEGWEDFQRLHKRFVDIIGSSPKEIQSELGYSVVKASRAKGDIASWFEVMRYALVGILPNGN